MRYDPPTVDISITMISASMEMRMATLNGYTTYQPEHGPYQLRAELPSKDSTLIIKMQPSQGKYDLTKRSWLLLW
jgi:hypothetical protein